MPLIQKITHRHLEKIKNRPSKRLMPLFIMAFYFPFFCYPVEAGSPSRIISTNLCTDQWLIDLVPPSRVIGLSPLAKNHLLSAEHEKAKPYKTIQARTEAIVKAKPDLILMAERGQHRLESRLNHFKFNIMRIPEPKSLEEMAAVAQHLGQVLSAGQKAEAIIKRIEKLRSLQPPSKPIPVLWWWEGGLSGNRHPLLVDTMQRIGVEIMNPPKKKMGVEDVLMAGAEIVVAPSHYASLPALSSERINHPALQHGTQPLLVLSGSHFTCLTPTMLKGVDKLKQLLSTKQKKGE
jgi:iron complex transport system substrate-binding protein